MYEVTVTTVISASHHLRGYRGKCENVHGHNYRVEACVQTDQLDPSGLGLDFGVLRKHLEGVAERFDHHDLNEQPEFKEQNPSSENLARVIFDLLVASLTDLPVQVGFVRIHETEGSSVTYRRNPG